MEKSSEERPNDPENLVFKRPQQHYYVWQEKQGIPIHKTFYVEDVATVEVGDWDLFGCKAAFINLTDSFLVGSYILEIAPGQTLKQARHLFEASTYIISGRGETEISQDGKAPTVIGWQARSLFAPPLNTTYTHRNLDRSKPARLLVVNNAPMIMSLFHDDSFIFDNQHAFRKRYDGQEDFFSGVGSYLGSRLSRVNYVQDLGRLDLYDWALRGKGAKTTFLSISDNTMAAHVSSFEVGTYKKAHRHGAGAHVVMLDGEGYSLLWREGEPPQRVEWKAGTMFAPPEWWYHQHFNTGKTPARYLAVRNNNPEHPLRTGLPRFQQDAVNGMTQFGKAQIEFEEEDPSIFEEYARVLAAKGVELRQQRHRAK